jgi:hypothetical protein
MPRLRSVRVVNAQFNEGRGLYQDFRLPFYGRNGTYELGNGMGKSVLLMLILQCVLPNAAPDPNKPFKYMFAGGDRNRTTHVLAEWELDEVVDGRRYLLTGFCAKRSPIRKTKVRATRSSISPTCTFTVNQTTSISIRFLSAGKMEQTSSPRTIQKPERCSGKKQKQGMISG